MISNFILRWKIVIYSLFGGFLFLMQPVWGINYDDSGVKGIVFWVSLMFEFFQWLTGEVLFFFNNGRAMKYHVELVILTSVVVAFVFNICVIFIKKAYTKSNVWKHDTR